MKCLARLLLTISIVGLATQSSFAQDIEQPIALVGATLITGTGAPPTLNATIVVQGDRILAAGAGVTIPPNARVIPSTGRWIIPGMIETHAHLSQSARPGAMPFSVNMTSLFPPEQEQDFVKGRARITLSRYLCSGVTSVAVQGATAWDFEVRKVADSSPRAPRVFLAGGPIAIGNVPGPPIRISSASDVAALLDSLTANRIDSVKAGLLLPPTLEAAALQAELQRLTPGLVELVRDSHSRGYRVAVHATGLAPAKAALQAGADVLAHAVLDDAVDDAFLDLVRARGAITISTVGTGQGRARLLGNVFTLEEPEATCGDPEVEKAWHQWAAIPQSERPDLPARMRAMDANQRLALENVRKMHAARLPIAVGTDAGNIGTQHGPGFQRELGLLARAGLTPMEVIVAATRNGARALGLDKDLGTLQAGKFADLVVLSGNPLEDVANLDRILQVMIRGKIVTRTDLRAAFK